MRQPHGSSGNMTDSLSGNGRRRHGLGVGRSTTTTHRCGGSGSHTLSSFGRLLFGLTSSSTDFFVKVSSSQETFGLGLLEEAAAIGRWSCWRSPGCGCMFVGRWVFILFQRQILGPGRTRSSIRIAGGRHGAAGGGRKE